MGHAPTPPPMPDYVGAANAQGAANLEAARATAKLNNPNMVTPYGTTTVQYGLNGDQDVPTITQKLNPEEQQLLNKNMQVQQGLSDTAIQGIGNVQNVLGSSFDASTLPAQQINPGQTAQDAIMSRLKPQIAQDREMLDSKLANQGIMQGSEAYNNAMRLQQQQENDARTQAALQGINVGQQARQQALSEATTLRELPLNEITALMSGSQVQGPPIGNYQGAQTQAGNYQGAVNSIGNYQADNFARQQAIKNSNIQSGTSLATMGALALML